MQTKNCHRKHKNIGNEKAQKTSLCDVQIDTSVTQ